MSDDDVTLAGSDDDVTLGASDDVVAQIRAHAAKVRRGEAAPDEELHVWTADPEPVEDGHRFVGETDRPLLPNDDTVVSSDGSARFFANDKTHRAGGMDFGPRHRAGGQLPSWAWIVLGATLIVLVLVGAVVAVAAMGPVT